MMPILLIACATRLSAATDDQIAKSFFPDELTQEAATKGSEVQDCSFVRADLDHSGQRNYLAVAYGNGITGMLRLLKITPGGAHLVADAQAHLLGMSPTVQAIDFDGDGTPEFVVSYRAHREHRNYDIFRWSNAQLVSVSDSMLDVDFIDLYGDGKIAIVEPPDEDTRGTPEATCTVYTLQKGGFTPAAAKMPYLHEYERTTTKPYSVTQHFTAVPGSCVLHVTNGTSGNHRADNAVITLNGKAIFGPDDFKTKRKRLTATADLLDENTITVELRSKPGSELTIAITTP